jgi:hypothetical protein
LAPAASCRWQLVVSRSAEEQLFSSLISLLGIICYCLAIAFVCAKHLTAGPTPFSDSRSPVFRGLEPLLDQLRAEKLMSPELSERLSVQLAKQEAGLAEKREVESFLTKDQQAEVA